MKDFTKRITRKNKDNFCNLALTISAQYGLVDQISFFNKTIASKDMSGYYLLKNGEFAYNKSYSKDYPWGTIKRLDLYDQGCLSTLYICFKCNEKYIDSSYLVHYFESPKWHKQVANIAGEGARNHGLLNIAIDDFFMTKHKIPSLEEQRKIAKFFNLIDERIQTQIKIISDKISLKNQLSNDFFTSCHDYLKLDEFIKYGKAGGTPKSTNKDYYNGKIPFLSISDITEQGKYITRTSKTISKLGIKNSSSWIVPENSLILSMYASVGLPTINKISLATSQAMYSMILKDSDNLEFLYYYLCYFQKYKLNSYLETGTQSNINANTVKSISIPNINKIERIKIANIMTKIDYSISFEKEILDNYQLQKCYLLKNMFI